MNMIIEDIKEKHGVCTNEITARMITGTKKSIIWFCWNGNSCLVPGDVFLCALLERAMNRGGKLIFNGSVSSRLANLLPQIQEALLKNDNSLRPVDIVIKNVLDIAPQNKRNETIHIGRRKNWHLSFLFIFVQISASEISWLCAALLSKWSLPPEAHRGRGWAPASAAATCTHPTQPV